LKILFLTPQLPHPPKQGTAIRNWGLIKSLSARHEITLLSFGDTNFISDELRGTCKDVYTVPMPRRTILHRLYTLAFSSLPDIAHRLASDAFTNELKRLLDSKRFDAMFIEGLELGRYLIELQPINTKVIFDAHNAEILIQLRAHKTDMENPRRFLAARYSQIQSILIGSFERLVCRSADYVSCVSEDDAKILRDYNPKHDPVVVPNGIFLSDYTSNFQLPTSNFKLVFTGKMDYRPNIDAVVWFAHEIFPKIKNEIPETEFVIVGQKPTQAVKNLESTNGIKVTGAVDDIRPHISGATVYVAPLRMGGGTRFKLLEAMALKKPIVSTTIGAEGFAIQNGREMLIADNADSFAQATISLLRNETKRRALSEAGYEFVKRYDWGEIVPRVEKIILLKP